MRQNMNSVQRWLNELLRGCFKMYSIEAGKDNTHVILSCSTNLYFETSPLLATILIYSLTYRSYRIFHRRYLRCNPSLDSDI